MMHGASYLEDNAAVDLAKMAIFVLFFAERMRFVVGSCSDVDTIVEGVFGEIK